MVSSSRILLTTSRNPTHRMRTFCNDFSRVISGIVRVNRGKMSIDEVGEKALELGANRVVIVDRLHGEPSEIKLLQISKSGLVLIPPIIHIASIKLQREFGSLKVKPALSLVLQVTVETEERLRFAKAFSEFLNIPILSMDEAIKTSPTLVCISRDKAEKIAIAFLVEPNHVEVGPRIVVSSLEW